MLNSTGNTCVLMDVTLYCVYTCMYLSVYICVCVYWHAYICIHAYIGIYKCECICVYVHICMCVYICVCAICITWFYFLLVNKYFLLIWCTNISCDCACGLQVLLRTYKLHPESAFRFSLSIILWLVVWDPMINKPQEAYSSYPQGDYYYLKFWISSPWNWWRTILFFHFANISGRTVSNKTRWFTKIKVSNSSQRDQTGSCIRDLENICKLVWHNHNCFFLF